MNVLTLAEQRGQGYRTTIVFDVLNWARSVHADRVDLSATPARQRLYEWLGFTMTSAPRMKFILSRAMSRLRVQDLLRGRQSQNERSALFSA